MAKTALQVEYDQEGKEGKAALGHRASGGRGGGEELYGTGKKGTDATDSVNGDIHLNLYDSLWMARQTHAIKWNKRQQGWIAHKLRLHKDHITTPLIPSAADAQARIEVR